MVLLEPLPNQISYDGRLVNLPFNFLSKGYSEQWSYYFDTWPVSFIILTAHDIVNGKFNGRCFYNFRYFGFFTLLELLIYHDLFIFLLFITKSEKVKVLLGFWFTFLYVFFSFLLNLTKINAIFTEIHVYVHQIALSRRRRRRRWWRIY